MEAEERAEEETAHTSETGITTLAISGACKLSKLGKSELVLVRIELQPCTRPETPPTSILASWGAPEGNEIPGSHTSSVLLRSPWLEHISTISTSSSLRGGGS